MFRHGIYFAEDSSKANQYVFNNGCCPKHRRNDCYKCLRFLLLVRVMLGKTYHTTAVKTSLANLPDYDSITAEPSTNLKYREYVVRKGDQTYVAYIIKYIIRP